METGTAGSGGERRLRMLGNSLLYKPPAGGSVRRVVSEAPGPGRWLHAEIQWAGVAQPPGDITPGLSTAHWSAPGRSVFGAGATAGSQPPAGLLGCLFCCRLSASRAARYGIAGSSLRLASHPRQWLITGRGGPRPEPSLVQPLGPAFLVSLRQNRAPMGHAGCCSTPTRLPRPGTLPGRIQAVDGAVYSE